MTIPFHDPQAVLDYAVDWKNPPPGESRGWLAEGETITAYTVTITPAGLIKQSDSQVGGVVTAWLSGGTAGQDYAVTFHMTTNQGRQDERTMRVRVRNR